MSEPLRKINIWTSPAKIAPFLKWFTIISLMVVYNSVSPWLLQNWGVTSRLLVFLFIIPASLFWGWKGGMLTALANLIPGMFVHQMVGIKFQGGLAGPIFVALMAVVLGKMRDLNLQLEEELVKRNQAEQKLLQHKTNLEGTISERTAELEKTNMELQTEMAERIRLTNILESTSDLVAIATPEGRMVYINQAGRDMMGWKHDEDIRTKKTHDIHSDGTLRILKEEWIQVAIRNGVWKGESTVIGPEGMQIPVSQVIMSHNSPDGELEFFSTIIRDITDLKLADATIKESEKRFQELTDFLPIAIFELDVNGKVTYVNKKAYEHFGYTPHDIEKGLSGFDLISPEDRQRAMEKVQQILQGKKGVLSEYSAIKHDGSTFPAMLHSAAILHDGKPIGLRGVLIDISENKILEGQLRQAQKIEAIGTLAGGIAHDFNNILTPLLLHTEMSLHDLPQDSPVSANLHEVLNAGNRAKDLVKQILTFSRKSEQKHIPLQLNLLVKEAVKFVRSSIPATIEIQEDLQYPAYVLADPVQIHQVLMNLCTNAFHAMKEGRGTLTLSLAGCAVDENKKNNLLELNPGNYVQLTVQDTGKGMNQEIIGRIFDPFFTTKSREEETGLGLSVVHGIIASHGGAIIAKSLPGVGSTFTVYLPLVDKKKLSKQAKTATVPRGSDKILFVDDELKVVEVNRIMLTRLGYDVVSITDPAKACELFREDPQSFDLLVTDLTMPAMTGMELIRTILQVRPDMPVILSTGFITELAKDEAAALGVRAILIKPFTLSRIAVTIREVMDTKR